MSTKQTPYLHVVNGPSAAELRLEQDLSNLNHRFEKVTDALALAHRNESLHALLHALYPSPHDTETQVSLRKNLRNEIEGNFKVIRETLIGLIKP